MPTTGPNAGMQHTWAARESGWNTGMDANLKKIDALMGGGVKDKDLATPPGSPADGDRYIVAVWESAGSAWTLYTPKKGWLLYVDDEDKYYKFTTVWVITAI